jgi:hypothetical protein
LHVKKVFGDQIEMDNSSKRPLTEAALLLGMQRQLLRFKVHDHTVNGFSRLFDP